MKNRDKQSLVIYGTNFAGNYIPKIGHLFNPLGAIVFGGIDIAKRVYDRVDNPYVRTLETAGGLYYSLSAISNLFSSLNGNLHDLGRCILDASMAYQLLVNEGVLDNIKNKRTEGDIKKIKSDLEGLLRQGGN